MVVNAPSWACLKRDETLSDADRRFRLTAKPIDRRVFPDRLTAQDFLGVRREQLLVDFWGAEVPGSGAWDSMFLGAASSHLQHGYISNPLAARAIEELVRQGLRSRADGDDDRCMQVAEQVLERFRLDMSSWYPPATLSATERARNAKAASAVRVDRRRIEQGIHTGWLGQIAGGSFGTVLEGCTGKALAKQYGVIDSYIGEVVTLNDDCVYELVALEVIAEHGFDAGTRDYAEAWRRYVPFAWSAEWNALDQLQRNPNGEPMNIDRIGWFGNPMHDWIGAQMRAMVFGLLAPGDPQRASALSLNEGAVSHAGGGLEGAVYSAVLTSLAFTLPSIRDLLARALLWLDQTSSYARVVNSSLEVCRSSSTFSDAWTQLDIATAHHNWIHAEPNIAAVIAACWFGEQDFTKTFSLLAQAGLDVDCNAGLAGTLLGVINGTVPTKWAAPLNDTIDTYLPHMPQRRISEVSDQTAMLTARNQGGPA